MGRTVNNEREERVWDVAFVQELARQQEFAIQSGVEIDVDIACAAADAAIESLRASGRFEPVERPSTPTPMPGTTAHLLPLIEQIRRFVDDAAAADLEHHTTRDRIWHRLDELAGLLNRAVNRRT